MPVEERSLTSRGVRKRGKAWLLARAYQSHYVSEIPDRITRASVISSVSRMREIRTSGLMSGGLKTQSREPNCRHGAKATERPPDPKAGAPAPDSSAPWKGAFSWWDAKPTQQLSFRLVAAGAGHGGCDMD